MCRIQRLEYLGLEILHQQHKIGYMKWIKSITRIKNSSSRLCLLGILLIEGISKVLNYPADKEYKPGNNPFKKRPSPISSQQSKPSLKPNKTLPLLQKTSILTASTKKTSQQKISKKKKKKKTKKTSYLRLWTTAASKNSLIIYEFTS